LRLHGPDEPVYTIGVAARLLDVNPQMLRVLERCGLVCPYRTETNIRLYSENDLLLLRRICYLIREERINVAGVRVILRMEGFMFPDEQQEMSDQDAEDEDEERAGRGRPGGRTHPT